MILIDIRPSLVFRQALFMLLFRESWDSPSLFMSIFCPKISWLQILLDNSILWLKKSVYELRRFGKATDIKNTWMVNRKSAISVTCCSYISASSVVKGFRSTLLPINPRQISLRKLCDWVALSSKSFKVYI